LVEGSIPSTPTRYENQKQCFKIIAFKVA